MTKTMNEIIDRYINECETIIRSKNHEEAKIMIVRVQSTFGKIIPGLFSNYPEGLYPLQILSLLKDKMEIYAAHAEYELLKCNPQSQTFINQHASQSNKQNTEVSVSLSFDQAVTWAQTTYSSDDKLRDEIIQKIRDIQAVSESSSNRNSKWDRAKQILDWLSTQGVDIAIKLIPLFLQSIAQ